MSKQRVVKTPGVYSEPGGTYYTKYKNITKRGHKSVDDALVYLAKQRLNEGVHEFENVSFSLVASHFLEFQYQRYKEHEITFATYLDYKSIYNNHLRDLTQNINVNKLNGLKLRELRVDIFEYEMSTKHKNNVMRVLKSILKHSQKYFEVKEDFTIYLDNFTTTSIEKRERKNRLTYIWTEKDFANFLSFVKDDNRKLAFILFFKHGLRLNEARALLWQSWDSKTNFLTIDGNMTKKTESGKEERKETKTEDSTRVIYVGEKTAVLINNLKSTMVNKYGFNENWYLLGDSVQISEKKIRHSREQAVKASGLPYATNHDMRHMFVTNAWSSVPITAISRYIGHKNVEVTLKEYSHLSEDDNNKLNEYIDKLNI